MPDPSFPRLGRLAPAPLCLLAGVVTGILTDDPGLWICAGIAVGAALTGFLAWSARR